MSEQIVTPSDTMVLAVRIAELEAAIDRISDALVLILPMAKGYAAEHDVGNNQKMIASAETALQEQGDG